MDMYYQIILESIDDDTGLRCSKIFFPVGSKSDAIQVLDEIQKRCNGTSVRNGKKRLHVLNPETGCIDHYTIMVAPSTRLKKTLITAGSILIHLLCAIAFGAGIILLALQILGK